MVLIDREQAAKLIRQNKDTHEDCQGAIHYNIGCEHSAQIVEQMKGQEIIHCKDCKHYRAYAGRLDGYCYKAEWYNRYQNEDDFCSRGER